MKLHIWSLFLLVVLFGVILQSCEGQLFKNLFGKLYGKLSKNGKHHGKQQGKHHGKHHHHQKNQPERPPLVIDDQEGIYKDFVTNVLPFLPTPAPAPIVSPQKKDEPFNPLKHFPGPLGPNGLPLAPYIRLGGLVPPGFRVVNNFKESFEVRLPAIVSHSPNQPYPWDKTVKNLGSIMSQSKIYISPEYPVLRRQPNLVTNELKAPSFSDSEAVVNLFNSVSDIMREKVKQVSKYQYRSFQEDQEVNSEVDYDPSKVERPVVIVHLQSYSSLRPNLTGIDEDVADAQRTYGFSCGAFEFGKTETVARILSSLRQSNIEPIDINEIGGSQDEINDNVFFRFNKFVNSTRKVHLWAHTRSEVDAVKRFRLPFLEGGYGEGPTGKSFQDTAPVTDTLAVAFL